MAKEIYCLLPLVGFCLHFCLEDYCIVLDFRCFCCSLKIVIYGQRFQLIINVSFWRVVTDDIDWRVSWLFCTSNRLRIRSIECITKVQHFSLHIIVVVLLGIIVKKFINNFIIRANFCFDKFNFFFKCGNYSFINERLILFFVVQV